MQNNKSLPLIATFIITTLVIGLALLIVYFQSGKSRQESPSSLVGTEGQTPEVFVVGADDICAATFTVTQSPQPIVCGQKTCDNNSDCANGLVCATETGYCSVPKYLNACNDVTNPASAYSACCTEPKLTCGDKVCDEDSDCGNGLACANSGYCSMPEHKNACNDVTNPNQAYNACCKDQPKQCGETPCTNDDDCAGDLVCATESGYCSMPQYENTCNDASNSNEAKSYCCTAPTPTPTPTVTPTPTPTATPYPGCYDTCKYDSDCTNNMKCQSVNGTNRCVNPDCNGEPDCVCDTPTPPPAPELPRAGGIPPTLIFTLGGVVLVALGLLF